MIEEGYPAGQADQADQAGEPLLGEVRGDQDDSCWGRCLYCWCLKVTGILFFLGYSCLKYCSGEHDEGTGMCRRIMTP
jgi:hypothetical protein